MKILLIIESSGAGVGRHVIDLAGDLARGGQAVHLIYSPLRVDGLFARGLEELRALGVPMMPLAMKRSPHPKDAGCCLAIRRYLKQHGPFDVVHGHSSKGGALARLSGIGLPGIRVYTPHAMFTMNPGLRPAVKWVFATIERVLGWFGDGIILVSEDERQHALEVGLPARKLFVITNGIRLHTPPPAENLRAKLGLPADALSIGFVGRFVPQKAPENLLRAFAALAGRFPKARLVMVGDGALGPALRDEAQKLGIADRVTWPGPLDGPSAMFAFDIFALPSRYEGFPYVLLEAMAAKLPVVMTHVGGAGSLVLDGENGLVVPPDRADLLEAALERLLADDGLRLKMGARSGERVHDFSIGKMVEKTLALYGSLAARPGRQP
ncbi:MAG: glycosyltransferase [Verrucomicrobia bacterium]|nr:glycosyltransferase [Verrucomicrobiota bacterium]